MIGITPLATAGDYTDVDFKTHLILQSNDEPSVEFSVLRSAANMSNLIKDLTEESEEGDHTVIPIPNVNARVLSYVIGYCNHHWDNRAAEIVKPMRGKVSDNISEWDKLFIFTDLIRGGEEKEHSLLLECMLAANFLRIPDLLNLTAASVASMMREKTPQEIRDLFGIEDDGFTPEEREELRRTTRWVEE